MPFELTDHRFALAVDVHRDGAELRVTAIGVCSEPDVSVH